jgi:hypothetical protein
LLPSSFTSTSITPQPPPPPNARRDFHSTDGGIPIDTDVTGSVHSGTDLPSDRREFH